jgi:basic membrane protein A
VGVLFISDPFAMTGGYDVAHYEGIRDMQREIGLTDAQIIIKANVPDMEAVVIEYSIRECISKGANIIIATSWGYMDVCEKMASLFPQVIFAHASGYKRNATNFTNYFGRFYQPRYLSGIAAGLKTRTNKIGYVAPWGKENCEVTGGLNAFALGVERVNPQARIYVAITNSWYDPPGETKAAQTLIAEGCDVITQDSDTSNPQIEAQKAQVWGIGYNSDMSKDAPEAVLTSVVWHWGRYYSFFIRSVIEGTFTTTPYYGSIAEGIVDITPLAEHLIAPGTEEMVKTVRDQMIRGEFKVFEGVMETNEGQTVGTEGGVLSDQDITLGMHWYYRTITVL